MSAEVELLKKLVTNDQVVAAVEIPNNHKNKVLLVDDLEEVLARFDDDVDYAHFVIRVKRASQPLPKPTGEATEPQYSIDSMVNETLALSEKITERRETESDPSFLLENAKVLEENNDFALARNIYQALVRKGVHIPQGLAGIARTHEREGDLAKAIRCYQEAIAYSSEFPFYQAMAALQIRLGEDQEASQSLLHSLGLPNLSDEQRFDVHKSLGNCFTRLGEYPKAEHHYRKAYELNAASDILQVNVGSLALQKGDFEAARSHFQKAMELNASNDKALSGLGMVCLSKGEAARAYDLFVSSLKLNINNLGTIFNLVKCAYELKKYDDAAMLLKRHIDQNPVNTNILYSYAGILYHQGEYSIASNEVKKILESNPGHAGAKELQELIDARLK